MLFWFVSKVLPGLSVSLFDFVWGCLCCSFPFLRERLLLIFKYARQIPLRQNLIKDHN